MRSDLMKKLDSTVEERSKLLAKVKELEDIVFKVKLCERNDPYIIVQSPYVDLMSVCSFKTIIGSVNADVSLMNNFNSNS